MRQEDAEIERKKRIKDISNEGVKGEKDREKEKKKKKKEQISAKRGVRGEKDRGKEMRREKERTRNRDIG